MFDKITFGQYYPAESAIHRLDPRTKLILTVALAVTLFIPNGFVSLLIAAVFTFAVYLISRVPLKLAFNSIKAILPLIIIMTVLNVFYIKGGTVLFEWWVFTISTEGIKKAVFMAARIILLIVTTSLLTYTTSPIDLTDGLERLLRPLKVVKVPVHDLAMIMTIALRFIPTLMEEAEKIMCAQKARGADIDTGNFAKRVKALIPILVPLLVSAVRRAAELATAMDCRCYQGGEGRTQMKQSRLHFSDGVAFILTALLITAVILTNMFIGI